MPKALRKAREKLCGLLKPTSYATALTDNPFFRRLRASSMRKLNSQFAEGPWAGSPSCFRIRFVFLSIGNRERGILLLVGYRDRYWEFPWSACTPVAVQDRFLRTGLKSNTFRNGSV